MKPLILILSLFALAAGIQAESPKGLIPPFGAQDLLSLVPGLDAKTLSELTLAERARLSDALSIKMQEDHYVARAAIASFLVPGLGQFMIGKPLEGGLFLAAQVAIVAGTAAGVHYLLPSGFTPGSRGEMGSYVFSGNIVEVLPAMGVMAGGMALSLTDMFLASGFAASGARENVVTGKVKFEPRLISSRFGLGLGFGLGL